LLLWSRKIGPRRSLAPETEPFAELDALGEALSIPELDVVSELIGSAEFIVLPEPPVPAFPLPLFPAPAFPAPAFPVPAFAVSEVPGPGVPGPEVPGPELPVLAGLFGELELAAGFAHAAAPVFWPPP
jgi:hypothetical protein